MKQKFIISFSCSSKDIRPPLSYKVREYYSTLIEKSIFENKIISLQEGWRIDLVIMFIEEAPRFKTAEIVLGKKPTIEKSEKVKIYHLIVPMKLVVMKGNSLDALIDILQEALTLFFTATFKKVTLEIMQHCWEKVDVEYLRSLPFPAPLREQKYVSDIPREDGSINFYQF